MFRYKALAGCLIVTLLAGLGAVVRGATAGSRRPTDVRPKRAATYLEIYYSSPMLVSTGERVFMPVDVVCATAGGRACAATVTLGTQAPGEPWQLRSAPAVPGLEFDVTAPARRAAGRFVRFFLRAWNDGGRSVTVPPCGARAPLRFYVARSVRTVRMSAIRFGAFGRGTTKLFLPWGSGPHKAGVEIGRESPTLGPSGFDIDRRGRVYLLDGLQARIAVLEGNRVVGSMATTAGPGAALAVGRDGDAFVATRSGGSTILRRLGRGRGQMGSEHTIQAGEPDVITLGPGFPSQVRVIAAHPFVRTLPLDAWLLSPEVPVSAGMPLAGGAELIRIGREDRLRIGRTVGGGLSTAEELLPPPGTRLGEVALADVDGRGGYWVVVRVRRDRPTPADQFEVVHLANGGVETAFGVDSRTFADAPPLGRFVIGRDGLLYQMTSSPAGVRIVRYELKGGGR